MNLIMTSLILFASSRWSFRMSFWDYGSSSRLEYMSALTLIASTFEAAC
jgi:hypothetical protein